MPISSVAHLGQPPSDSPCLLCSEVEGEVLLVLVVFTKVLAGLLVHNSKDTSNGLADGGAICK